MKESLKLILECLVTAAAAMYQHGRQLAEIQSQPQVDFLESASAQAMSYLAAINALSLVDSKNAWIEFAVPPSESNQVSHRIHVFNRWFCLNQCIAETSKTYTTHPGQTFRKRRP